MNIIKKYSLVFFSTIIFFFIYCKLLFETYYFNAFPKHDTLWSYIYFQYVYNYFELYQSFPSWIETNTGGYPALGIINFSSSAIAFPIIFLSNAIGIGSYFSYIILISIFTSIFYIGLYLFIKDNTKKYLLIFSIIAISYLFSTDFFFISQSHWWYTLIPLQIFFLIKFFKKKDEKFIFYLINSQLIFSALYWTYYNIFSIYLISLIVLIFFFTVGKIYKNKINLKVLFIKNYLNIFLLIFLIFLNFLIFLYFKENYYVNTPFRISNLTLSDYGFIGNIPLAHKFKKILFDEYAQSFYSITITNISLVFFLYVLLNLKTFLKNYFLVSLIFVSILVIIISCGNEYKVSKFFIDFLRIFPFMDIFKHYGYVIHFLIPLSLLITSISLNHFLETKNKKNIFQSCIIVFLLKFISILIFFHFFNEYYDNFFKKKILVNLFLSFLAITLGLYFLVNFKKFKNKYFIIIPLIFFSIFPSYKFAFEKYKSTNEFKYVKNFYFQNNFLNKEKCITFEEALDNISYFKYILSFPGNKYNIINLNLQNKICKPFAKIAVDGSEKNFSKYFYSGQSIELKNTNLKNSLYLNDLFRNLKIKEDLNLDGKINNEDKYLMISNKTKISFWTVIFRIEFAEAYLNDGIKNKRYPQINFYENKDNNWVVKVDENFKNEPLFKIIDNMVIKNEYKNQDDEFIFELIKNKNSYNFSTNDKGKFKLKLSFNENWKLKDIIRGKFIKTDNENGYLTFEAVSKSKYILYYKNKIEFLIIFCQIIIISILMFIFIKGKFKQSFYE